MNGKKTERQNKTEPKKCKRCGNDKGMISKYRIFMCRRCFKDLAEQIGFRKYD